MPRYVGSPGELIFVHSYANKYIFNIYVGIFVRLRKRIHFELKLYLQKNKKLQTYW